jgi:hypothetical protein
MVELIPMALIAVFGYLVYRWSAATNKSIRQERHAPPNQRDARAKLQASDSENEPRPQPTGA